MFDRLVDDYERALRTGDYLGQCVLCGEEVRTEGDLGDPAEMNGEPIAVNNIPVSSGLCHAQCGMDVGWEIS